ncbi:hypothetical protein D1007_11604 [Hordeum vulgare]|nr:hypothetical protein D1007_11604 [Hordeum vulgare]
MASDHDRCRGIGLKQCLLLEHIHVRLDGHASGKLLLYASVIIVEVDVVLLVGMRVLECGMPLFQHHLGVMSTGLADGDVDIGQSGHGCRLVAGRLFHLVVASLASVCLRADCNGGNLLLLL